MPAGIKLQQRPKSVSAFDRFNNAGLDEDFVNERINRNRDMASALLGQNAQTFVQSPTQGLAMLARALNARDFNKQAESEQSALRDQRNQQLGNLMASIPPEFQQQAAGLPRGVLEQVGANNLLERMTPAGQAKQQPVDNFGDKQGNFVTSAVRGTPEWTAAVNNPELGLLGNISQVQRSEVTNLEDPRTQSQRGKDVQVFNDAGQGAAGAIDTTTDLANIAITNPAALGMPGGMARFANDWVQTGKQLVSFLDPTGADFEPPAPESFDYSKLRGTAIDNAQFRSGVFSVAFAAAVAKQGTRPTDKDIQAFIDQIAGSATDPISFMSVAGDFNRRMVEDVKRSARIKGIPDSQQEVVFKELDDAMFRFNEVVEPGRNVEGYNQLSAEKQRRLNELMRQQRAQ